MRKSKDLGLSRYPKSPAITYLLALHDDTTDNVFLSLHDIISNETSHRRRAFADRTSYSGYLPLIIYLGYTRSVPRPSLIKYDSTLGTRTSTAR
jgi:hypothetical protein